VSNLNADLLDGQHASAFAGAGHNHLGQTWTGSNNPLVITGTFGAPNYAALVLGNTSTGGDGLRVSSAGTDGVEVWSAAVNGVEVWSAAVNGVCVRSAGQSGLTVWSADGDGVYVSSAGYDGVAVGTAARDGLSVGTVGYHGVFVFSAGDDGVEVWHAGEDGVYANTTRTDHEWGFYTPDKIYAGTALASGGPLILIAQNGDGNHLEMGDVVAVSGAGAAFADGDSPLPLVQRVSPGSAAIGVVYRRLVVEEQVEEVERDGKPQRLTRLHTRGAEGPIAPGEYLFMVVLGPAQVKAEAASANIRPGDLLTVASGGKAVSLRAGSAEAYAPSAIIGTAMTPLDQAQGTGLIWVLVLPR